MVLMMQPMAQLVHTLVLTPVLMFQVLLVIKLMATLEQPVPPVLTFQAQPTLDTLRALTDPTAHPLPMQLIQESIQI